MRRHIRKDGVVDYHIVIIVIINSYSYKDMEPNEGVVKHITTVLGKKENTTRETS